jgi:hypothetical protein
MRANPSPIAALHRIDSEAVGFDQLEKPVLSAGNPFLRAFPVERQARPYGMAEIEYRRAGGDGRFGFDVEKENRHEAACGIVLGGPKLPQINATRQEAAVAHARAIESHLVELAHLSTRDAAAELNRRGVPTSSGKPWLPMAVLRARKRLAQ